MNTLLKTLGKRVSRVEKIRAIEEEILKIRKDRAEYFVRREYFDAYEAQLRKQLQELKR